MPRGYPHSHTCHGHHVGYSVKKRGNDPCFFLYFRGKDGRRLERDTNKIRSKDAHEAAHAIIEQEYAPAPVDPEAVSWDDTIERLKKRWAASGNRPATLAYYLKLIRLLRKVYPNSPGPSWLSPSGAERWRDEMMTTPGRKGKPRSGHYVDGLLVGLSALWQTWFMDELKIVPGNPWQDVTRPKVDKIPVRYATDDQVKHLHAWLAERFGDWQLPRLFLDTLEYTGRRLNEVCRLKSAQLRGGRLVFLAASTKGRKEQSVPLPEGLAKSLEAIKGNEWLWECYPAGLRAALVAKAWPSHQLKDEFTPERLYNWVETLFTEYREAFPDRPRLTPHMFRKRAFTAAWNDGMDMRDAAIAYSCHVETVMKHYVALDEQGTTDKVYGRVMQRTAQRIG